MLMTCFHYKVNKKKKGKIEDFNAFWRAILCLMGACIWADVRVKADGNRKLYITYGLRKGTRDILASILDMDGGGSIQSRGQQFKNKDLRNFAIDFSSDIKDEWPDKIGGYVDLKSKNIDEIVKLIDRDYHSIMFYIVFVFIKKRAFRGHNLFLGRIQPFLSSKVALHIFSQSFLQ